VILFYYLDIFTARGSHYLYIKNFLESQEFLDFDEDTSPKGNPIICDEIIIATTDEVVGQ